MNPVTTLWRDTRPVLLRCHRHQGASRTASVVMRRVGRFPALMLVGVVLVLVFVACSAVWTWQDDSMAGMTISGPYTPDVDSLNTHPLPQWFADAKFGIMVHWGLYSVPGFAPKGTTFTKLLETQVPARDDPQSVRGGLRERDEGPGVADGSLPP